MDDLSAVLSGFLSDPKAMEQISDMARQLGLGEGSGQPQPSPEDAFPGLSPELLSGIMEAMQESTKSDKTTELLSALEPHMTGGRKEKLDRAIRAIRMMSAAKALSKHVKL